MKKQASRPYRSVWNNALWSFRAMLKSAPKSFWLMSAVVPLAVFLAWAEIKLPALVVSEVSSGQTFAHAALGLSLLLGATFAAMALRNFCTTMLSVHLTQYRYRAMLELNRKSMRCFYQTFEKKATRDLQTRASHATEMWDGGQPLWDMPQKTLDLVQNALCYLLFGAVISFVSPLLTLFMTLAPLVNWFCLRAYNRYEYRTRPLRADVDKKRDYVTGSAGDFAAAKDIRLYGMADWLRHLYGDLFGQTIAWQKRLSLRRFCVHLADLGIILLRDGAAYALLISMALRGEISPGEFVLYFAAISNFATYVGNVVSAWSQMHTASLKVCDYREFLDLPDGDGSGAAHAEDFLDHAPEITFDHVSFRYEDAEKNTLDDVSFTLRAGERLALVGMNGAGKTTLVKLLCGLYQPTSGEIRIDGVSVNQFLRQDYYRLFSPVFQDIQTAFFSLAETVAGCFGPDVDRGRAEDCLRRAGMGEKLDSLLQGMDTKLDPQVHPQGIRLSGGEAQKVMMARALYKDAPVLVLDEPTSALDPIAENEIYLRYRDMTQGKTSLFISHRLASTRFCHRILFLQDGKNVEEGTHSQLMEKGGVYAKLYEIQSCWYRDDYKGGESA